MNILQILIFLSMLITIMAKATFLKVIFGGLCLVLGIINVLNNEKAR